LWDRQAKRPSGGEIDGEIEFGRLLERDISWLRSSQNFVNKLSCAAEEVWQAWAIRYQISHIYVFSKGVDGWEASGERQRADASPIAE